MKKLLYILLLLIIQNTAYAYIGPGMGGGMVVATLGIIVAIFAALFGLIWFPIKKLRKKKDKSKTKTS